MKSLPSRPARLLISIPLIALIILSACSGPGGASEAFPAGTFVPPVQRTAGITIVFSEDGTYNFSGPQLLPITGAYTLDKDRIVFTEKEGGGCAGIAGTYTWTFKDKALTFTPVDDLCSIRRIDWQAGEWSMQE